MRPLEAVTLCPIGIVGSSNDEAKSRALTKPEHGLMLVAEAQTKGRGSNQRTWISDSGNLYASLMLYPEIPHAQAQDFVKMAGLAVMDVLKGRGLKPKLKAPNDVLVEGKKICGILVETVTKGNIPPSVIIGIGLNVASHPDIPEYPTTSLRLYSALTLPELTAFLAESLRFRYESWRLNGFSPMEKEYHAACN